MILWLLLLGGLGIFTYIIVQRSVAHVTRTPVWLLWLVMMLPALIWTFWLLANGEDAQIPVLLLLGPFLGCPVLYWLLIQWGRPTPPLPAESHASSSPEGVAIASAESKPTIKPINRQEEETLHHCFPWTVFYLQSVEYLPQALICRGQLRSSAEVAYQTVRENIETQFGDRFMVVFQEGLNGKPFFALVANPQAQATAKTERRSLNRPGLALGLLLATLFTTTLAGVVLSGLDPNEFASRTLVTMGLPYALSLMSILGVHEFAHYWMAKRYQIRTTYPYFIPIPPTAFFPFGTFGAFIQMRSPVPHRKALFDIGIAGPLAGFLVTIPVLFWGLGLSQVVDVTPALTEQAGPPGFLNFELFNPTASFFIFLLAKLSLGTQLGAEQALRLHPVAIAGCIGVIVTALNLMPVGQLDGGHIVHAMFGQRTGALIGQVARLLVLALSFVQRELLLWAILLFFIPAVDEPALNDVSELDDRRDLLGLVALAVLVLIILPTPPAIARILF
ncbi:site-2 protease family protein [Leptolyngbya sp. AN02str]|uniref:site-2 protease family protein n=1 Tax=Leptolyngbya sp. AN02str TaxID=3423363 RepID=UPI003D31E515